VTQADLDAGEVVNTASLDATLPNGNAVPTLTDNVTVTGTASPELTISKSALAASYMTVGDTIDYEIVVGNIGNVTISDIVVDDPLIPSLSCPTDVLVPTQSLTCSGTYVVTQADIDAGQIDNSLVKTATTVDYDGVGDTIDYEYLVTNSGNVTLVDTISVMDDKIASVFCPLRQSMPSKASLSP